MLKASSVQCHAPAQLLNRELGERNREPSIQHLIKARQCYIKQCTLTEVFQPPLFIYLHFSICVIIKLRVEKEVRLHFNLMNLINSYICNPALNRCCVCFSGSATPTKATCVHSSHYVTSMLLTTVKATEGIVGYQRGFWWFPVTISRYQELDHIQYPIRD